MSLLETRIAQAPLTAALIRAYAKEVGWERAIEIATRVIAENARAAGAALAEKLGDSSIEGLKQVLETYWAEGGALEYDLLVADEKRLHFNVTRCRYKEAYQQLDIQDVGSCLSCCRDATFGEGFNPKIRLARGQTLMEGASHCDFRFDLEED